jgi:hypothetical protein
MEGMTILLVVGLVAFGAVLAVACIVVGMSLSWRFQGRDGKLMENDSLPAKAARVDELPEDSE